MHRRTCLPDAQRRPRDRRSLVDRMDIIARDSLVTPSTAFPLNVARARKPAPLGMSTPRAHSALASQTIRTPQTPNSVHSSSGHPDFLAEGTLASGRQLSCLSMAAITKELNQTNKDLVERNNYLEHALLVANEEIAQKVPLARDLAAANSNIQILESQLHTANATLAEYRRQRKPAQSTKRPVKQNISIENRPSSSYNPSTDDYQTGSSSASCGTDTTTTNSNVPQDIIGEFSLVSVSPSQTPYHLPSSSSSATAHNPDDTVICALQERIACLENIVEQCKCRQISDLANSCAEQGRFSDDRPTLHVSELDPRLRTAIESSIPPENLVASYEHLVRERCRHERQKLDPYNRQDHISTNNNNHHRHHRHSENMPPHASKNCEDELKGINIMNQIASCGLSDTSSTFDDEDNHYDHLDSRQMDLSDTSVLEAELYEERLMRIQKEARISQLMRILDDRTAVEQQRAAAATRAREAVEARLASVERALQAERAGREAAEREAAAILARVTRAQQAMSNSGSHTLGSAMLNGGITGRIRRRKGLGLFGWASSEDKSQGDDASSTSSFVSNSLLSIH